MGTSGNEARGSDLRKGAETLLAVDYFAALRVPRTATPEAVKSAFLKAVKHWHPDRVPVGLEELKPLFGQVFGRLEVARATLSDPERRGRYVASLATPKHETGSAADGSAATAALEFQKAEGLLKKHDVAQATAHLRRAVQLDPTNVAYQGLVLWLRAKPESSAVELTELASELDELIHKDARVERLFFYRAQLRKRLDRSKEAMADFARVIELNPKNVDAARELRIYRMRLERSASASAESREGAFAFLKKLLKR